MSGVADTGKKGVDIGRVRKFARNVINLPGKIEIHYEDGSLFTTGTAVVRDMSVKGARLGKILLRRQMLPAARFWIQLTFEDAQYQGIGAICRPVRFGPGKEFELAVEFENFWVREETPPHKKTVRVLK